MGLNKSCFHGQFSATLLLSLALLFPCMAIASNVPVIEADPHRNEVGFFDIHVCNWPDRPQFFYGLFASKRFNEIDSVELFRPDKSSLGRLNMQAFRVVVTKNEPVKQVYMTQFPTLETDKDGWYTATVTLKDGRQFEAKDFVKVNSLPNAKFEGLFPANGAVNISIPEELHWQPIDGARFYQVFITDLWDEGIQFYKSDILKENRLKLPPGLLKQGGLYSWRVHARDVNEDKILGDFNSGSLGPEAKFSVK